MSNVREYIEISLDVIESGLKLRIDPESKNKLYELEEAEALAYGESRFQLLEGNSYEYKFTRDNYRLKSSINGIVTVSNRDKFSGRITPNIYVGTLTLFVSTEDKSDKEYPVYIEILATKLNSKIDKSYRENYRYMLASITKKCTELLMQINSPVNQNFETNFDKYNETIYQRFAFIQSLINSDEFNESVQKTVASPTSKWKEEVELKDIRSIRKLNSSAIRQIVTRSNRFPLSENHYLTEHYGIKDIPTKILSSSKVETVDTHENRFIKHALEVFLKFCTDCENHFAEKKYVRPQKEALILIANLENHLNHPFFKEVSSPTTLRLNSPVLQRKSGYREILNSWLMFDLAAKLIWTGGEKVYRAGKRDVATLYEYWLFFTLYDLFKAKFNLDKHSYDEKPYEHLIAPTNDGLNVMVKSGKHTALEGVYDSGSRKLNIKFSYNRSFTGGKEYAKKENGSWTKALRPDYTLSIWPADMIEKTAEEKELIVHIHFDSKYKVDQFVVEKEIIIDSGTDEDSLEKEKEEERKGIYKNADLMKMHAYKDAIRRTGGAYILYPGTEEQKPYRGFHEIIPGLGAFAIRPSDDTNGIDYLSDFIDKIIIHFLDRASQRENISSKVYDIHLTNKKDDNILNEPMPEYFNGEKLIPDESYVLIGFSKNEERLKWYEEKGKYNFRMDDDKGSLILEDQVVNAKFLLLRKSGSETASDMYKIVSKGPKVYSKLQLENMSYPSPNKEYYLVIDIEKVKPSDFENAKWNFRDLKKYKEIINKNPNPRKGPGIPFAVTLKELMRTIVK